MQRPLLDLASSALRHWCVGASAITIKNNSKLTKTKNTQGTKNIMAKLTAATIKTALNDDRYSVRVNQNGGFQINLDLKRASVHEDPNTGEPFTRLTDLEKVQLLQAAFDRLVAAGIPVRPENVKLTVATGRGESRTYTSWPCIYVNQPESAGEGTVDVYGLLLQGFLAKGVDPVEAVTAAQEQLVRIKTLVGASTSTPAVVSTPESQPTSESATDDIPY